MGQQLPKRARRVATWAAVFATLLMVGACSPQDREQVEQLAMPVPATDRAPAINELWRGGWLAAIIVGILVWGLILYVVFHFRRRSDDEVPVQTRYNLPIEILYTVAPIVVVLVFFYFTIQTQNTVLASSSEEDGGESEHTINVIGAQWSWTFNYIGEEAVDGRDVYTIGTPQDFPTLVLPVNESVDINLNSPDVIHSFWVPSFLFKLDVVPGRDNSFSFTPTREGSYAGKCTEFCGVYHSRMLFNVEIVSDEEFDEHLVELAQQGNVGTLEGGEAADTPTGRQDEVQDDDTTGQGDAQ